MVHQSLRVLAIEPQSVRRQIDAGDEPHDIDRERCPARFVEIVDVKIAESVVALESAEIFQVQITADENARRAKQGVCAWQKIEQKRIGAAKERERILPQEFELHRQALEIPTGVLR